MSLRHVGVTDITRLLGDGDPVSIDEIRAMMASTPRLANTLHELPKYMGRLRRFNNGTLRVFKNGKKVAGYQLINYWQFNAAGYPLRGDALAVANAAHDAMLVATSVEFTADVATPPILMGWCNETPIYVPGEPEASPAVVTAVPVRKPYVSMADPTNMPLYLPPVVPAGVSGIVNGVDVLIDPNDQGEVPSLTENEPEGVVVEAKTITRGKGGKFTKKAA